MQLQKIFVNGERLKNTIEAFANFGRTDKNGVTRLSLTEEDVPSVNGKSHCEEELTSYEDCEKGVNVILETVMLLLSK